MLPRPVPVAAITRALGRSPITALLGPRQCGKTTLARQIASARSGHYLDLEAPSDRQRLQNPELLLTSMDGLVVLDEVQLLPELFNLLRVLVDRPGHRNRYLLCGSASPQIVKNVSETLAGRVEFVDLAGFDLTEIPPGETERLWLRGGLPRSFLAASDEDSLAWREGFIRTFLERDIPQLGLTIPPVAMRRFWTMLAHLHGQTWNASELGRSMGMSDKTVRHYLDILSGTYMVRQLLPWHENLKKRQVKAPKVYLRDSGLLHRLFHVDSLHDLLGHPRLGASWEGFALEQAMAILRPDEAYFWGSYSGAELDLLLFSRGKRFGIEGKFDEAPRVSRSMHVALSDLNLEHLWVVYPGAESYPVHERITVLPLGAISTLADRLERWGREPPPRPRSGHS
ncbi:MAG: ATP-binding protein [Thermodesulfobacteriota bacterium]